MTTEPYGKKNPFPAPVLSVRHITGEGSPKETIHIEYSLDGSGMNYIAGDALAVIPANDPALADALIDKLGLSPDSQVPTPEGETASLKDALVHCYDITNVNKALLTKWAAASGSQELDTLLSGDKDALSDFLWGRDVLADRLQPGHTARVFVHTNKNFRLPEDGDTPIIMVGPGTGIAPFRAFWEERAASGAKGGNWLFFGNPYRATDFCYEDELNQLTGTGKLKLSVAWSRDQEKKVYVQHLMVQEGEELWKWLEAGACFYVCGDASRMAKDVDNALHEVIQTWGHKTPEEAAAYVADMKQHRRYQRDVY